MKFVCPKCMRPLTVGERGVATCSGGHTFDRAREGYYNLLLSNAGGTHGDNREMLEARRRFLDTGAYKPLADKLSKLVLSDFDDGGSLLDIGCGEGYYTSAVSAFYDKEHVMEAYNTAVREKYRFFSFGDAMLIV